MSSKHPEDYPRIYAAGAMSWANGEDSYWRRSTENKLSNVTFYNPEDGHFDHAADGVIAYYSELPQVGTTVEVLHALHTQTPTLVMIDGDFLGERIVGDQPSSQDTLGIESIDFRSGADDHWFLINYLNGDEPDATQRSVPGWISSWEGFERGAVKAVEYPEEIPSMVSEWAENEFGVSP